MISFVALSDFLELPRSFASVPFLGEFLAQGGGSMLFSVTALSIPAFFCDY